MKLFFLATFSILLLSGCIKAPDDGMSLGDQTSADKIDQVMSDAQSGISEAQAFHVGDTGVIQSIETVYSSTQLKETDVYKLTSIDTGFFYYDDYQVKADKTTHYKTPRASASAAPSPTPEPTTPTSVVKHSWPVQKLLQIVKVCQSKINFIMAKVSVQTSTALGETLSTTQRKMDEADYKIKKDLMTAIETISHTTTVETEASNPSQYFGLKYYKHTIVTSNCSQVKDCKVTATHVEFNEISTANGASTQVHWVYEISKEVPGLFTRLSRCGSAVTVINNVQVPFMECATLDTFHFGPGTTPAQE